MDSEMKISESSGEKINERVNGGTNESKLKEGFISDSCEILELKERLTEYESELSSLRDKISHLEFLVKKILASGFDKDIFMEEIKKS